MVLTLTGDICGGDVLWEDGYFSPCLTMVVLVCCVQLLVLFGFFYTVTHLAKIRTIRRLTYTWVDWSRQLCLFVWLLLSGLCPLIGASMEEEVELDYSHLFIFANIAFSAFLYMIICHLEAKKGARESPLVIASFIVWLAITVLAVAPFFRLWAVGNDEAGVGPQILALRTQSFCLLLSTLMGAVCTVMYTMVNATRETPSSRLVAPLLGSFPTAADTALDTEAERGEDTEASRQTEAPRLAELDAGILSMLTFTWMSALMALGKKRPLQKNDLPEVHPKDASITVYTRFHRCWAEEEAKPKPSLLRALWKCFAGEFFSSGACQAVYVAATFLGPVLLNKIISFLQDDGTHSQGYLWVVALLSASVVQSFAMHQYFHRSIRLGMHLKSAVITEVYRKSLRIAPGQAGKGAGGKGTEEGKGKGKDKKKEGEAAGAVEASSSASASSSSSSSSTAGEANEAEQGQAAQPEEKKEEEKSAKSTGEIVNLMAVDAQRLQDLMMYFHSLWSAPVQVIVALVLLWQQVGIAVLAGLAVIILNLPMTGMVSIFMRNIQKKLMKVKDERIKITNETLSSMKVIKLYAWEQSFGEKIQKIREEELSLLWKYKMTFVWTIVLFFAAPIFVSVASFGTYVAMGNELDAATAFTALALFNALRFPLLILPYAINGATEGRVSVKRLQDFFESPEVEALPAVPESGRPALAPGTSAVEVQNAKLVWPNGNALLNDVSFKCKPGELTCVVGPTGCGKTGLVLSLINDVSPAEGTVERWGRIAYTAQSPWIQNASVRNNILFGKPYDAQFYAHVLDVCALTTDLAILPAGDATEIGEKGVNLSGGQKARVALARAVYARADIYILDDILAAVDSNVAHHIFTKCIREELKEKCVILVTHKLSLASQAEQIVFLRDQTVRFVGSFRGFQQNADDFAKFVAEEEEKERMDEERAAEEEAEMYEEEGIDLERLNASMAMELREQDEDGEHPPATSFASFVSENGNVATPEVPLIEQKSTSLARQRSSSLARQQSPAYSRQGSPSGRALRARTRTLSRLLSQETEKGVGLSRLQSGQTSKDRAGRTISRQTSKDAKKEKENAAGNLIDEETLAEGAVSKQVYVSYIRNAGGFITIIALLLTLALSQAAQVGANAWLSVWTGDNEKAAETGSTPISVTIGLGVYAAFSLGQLLLLFSQLVVSAYSNFKAAQSYHNKLLFGILRCPMWFFDTTPVGRMLNRFSKDMYTIDEQLQSSMQQYLSQLFTVAATVIVISYVTPWFLICLVPMAYIYWTAQQYYIASSRQLKRLDSVLKSPVFALFGETIDGASTIRAYRRQEAFVVDNDTKLDINNRAYYMSQEANRWLAIRLEFVGNAATSFCALLCIVFAGTIGAAQAGFALTYALQVTQTLNWLVRMACDLETNIVSVERVKEYAEEAPQEAALVVPDRRPPAEWPQQGLMKLDNVQLRYREGLPLVLKGVTLTILPGEKVGIVGRTGAGKSTMLLALLRLVEHAGGNVELDGVDISSIGLFDLRSKMAIIPQDPALFTGTVRFNLDPFNEKSNEEIWRAIRTAHLGDKIEGLEKGLEGEVEEGGRNFSLGERQLLCMARALLRKSRVLLLDEATSAVDLATDHLIQETIRTSFQDCTILTIAHRIDTILDYDKILVMEQGAAAEFAHPQELLKTEGSLFKTLAEAAGISAETEAARHSKERASNALKEKKALEESMQTTQLPRQSEGNQTLAASALQAQGGPSEMGNAEVRPRRSLNGAASLTPSSNSTPQDPSFADANEKSA
uniref:Uncharacterized protein n=1 Tax=Chromera velia CCMP2878 TaxID=1169474 RepID=A0A0G4EZM3_9ALVE|eukprot:Cvel_14457.t1-p1 / transcript=Cvel_14457.t1 / gene=Cvel_14457 / organism=Chromera_velia_CCMP2878 / gene_product=Canalicular multispecific organic anion transporter, putative / transcript_product=Canalicular multispecific organic anion transporter, putative / location=Cvel_scaffold1029:35836-48703(-) / protein_length=1771 / sequence_SO=supercontig / SO=protein_coding / is_pseudo=false